MSDSNMETSKKEPFTIGQKPMQENFKRVRAISLLKM